MAKQEAKKEAKKGRLELQREGWKKNGEPSPLSDRNLKSQIDLTLAKLESGKLSAEEADKANKYLDSLAGSAKDRKMKVKPAEEKKPEA